MTWIRFQDASPSQRDFHIEVHRENGGILTACNGGAAVTDVAEQHDAPDEARRCRACRVAIGELAGDWGVLVAAIDEAERSGVA